MDLITISRLKAARSCLRFHRYKFLDLVRPVREAEDTRFGSLIHRGLEAWWKVPAHARHERLDHALDALRDSKAEPFELAKAEVLLIGYDARWGDEPYEVIGVEVEFQGPLVNPLTGFESKLWRRGGKIDVIVRDQRDGRVLNVEHKTSSEDIRQGSEYWRRLRMDGQISGYFEGARFLGHDVAGCLYDVIGKPGLRQLKATPPEARKYTKATAKEPSRLYAGQRDQDETVQEFRERVSMAVLSDPAGYFQRGEVARLELDLREALLDDWHFAQSLREAIRLGRSPRNPDACVRWQRTCEYFDVCTGAASIDDPMRFRRADTAFPELTQLGIPKEREEKIA